MTVLKIAWLLGGGLCVLILNINSSHLSVPMPTINKRGSTQLCQHSELLIHNHRLALAHSVGHSLLWGAGRLNHTVHSHTAGENVCMHIYCMCTYIQCLSVSVHRHLTYAHSCMHIHTLLGSEMLVPSEASSSYLLILRKLLWCRAPFLGGVPVAKNVTHWYKIQEVFGDEITNCSHNI